MSQRFIIKVFNIVTKIFLVEEECPIGYAGKLPSCHDIDRFIDTFNFRHLTLTCELGGAIAYVRKVCTGADVF